jgi:hypothetical protein
MIALDSNGKIRLHPVDDNGIATLSAINVVGSISRENNMPARPKMVSLPAPLFTRRRVVATPEYLEPRGALKNTRTVPVV